MSSELWAFGYVSRSCIPAEDHAEEVRRIVADAIDWNQSMSITGAMLDTGEHFAQLVEGPQAGLIELRNKLEIDPRHRALVRFEWGPVRSRRFDEWALAYSGVSSFFARYLRRMHEGAIGTGDAERLVTMMRQFAYGSDVPSLAPPGSGRETRPA